MNVMVHFGWSESWTSDTWLDPFSGSIDSVFSEYCWLVNASPSASPTYHVYLIPTLAHYSEWLIFVVFGKIKGIQCSVQNRSQLELEGNNPKEEDCRRRR